MSEQLALGLQLSIHADFNNYIPGPNQQCVNLLKKSSENPDFESYYLWGPKGTGKTHLLQALCALASKQNKTASYIPTDLPAIVLDNLESLDIICIDNIDLIGGDLAWEEALFHCYNRARAANCSLVMTGGVSPVNLKINLPDLKSRVTWGLVFQLHELSDQDKQQVIMDRANALGLGLTNNVAQYLFAHHSRNLSDLMQCLDHLDHATLAEQRRLTIPFLKTQLTN